MSDMNTENNNSNNSSSAICIYPKPCPICDDKWQCIFCSNVFKLRTELKDHVKANHKVI